MELKLFHMGGIESLNNEQKTIATEFINKQAYTVIATNNSQTGVRLSCLSNMPEQKLDTLYFGTDSASTKIANIKSNAQCEILYTDGNSQLMLSGNAVVITDIEIKKSKWIDMMYEHFKDGPESEEYSLIEFRTSQARIMLAAESEYEVVKTESFPIVGIAIRTTNENNQSAADIGQLWSRFWNESVAANIPNRINDDAYCVYTEYDGDFTKPYTCIVGCCVESLDNIPQGMKGVTIEAGGYAKLTAKGNLNEGVVVKEWTKLWSSGLNRKYKTDYEHYVATSNPENAEVDIFIGIS